MRSSVIVLLLGLVYCLVAAAPFQKRSFKVERKRNVNFKGYNGPKELLKAYRKYNRPLSPALLEALKSHGGKPPATPSTQSKMGPGLGGAGMGGPGPAGPGGAMGPDPAMEPGPVMGPGPTMGPGPMIGPGPAMGLGAPRVPGAVPYGPGVLPVPGAVPYGPGVPPIPGAVPYQPGVPPEPLGSPFVGPPIPAVAPGADEPLAPEAPTTPAPPPGVPYPSPMCINGCLGIDSTLPPITPTGLVTATPETNDVEYLSPVTIGTQTLDLDFDTGSSDLWVFNTLLPAESTPGHDLFDPTSSSTFRLLPGTTFSIKYGDDSGASGVVGRDAVTVGGVQVPDQAVELATNVSGSFIEDMNSAGILGLAFSKLNTVQPERQKTFFDNLMPTLAEPVFTADLRSGGAVGAYEFGKIDTAKFKGEMAWVKVDPSDGFWQFETAGFAVGEQQARNGTGLTKVPGQAIVDTGTTLMLVAKEVSDGYYKQVDGAKEDPTMGGVTFPCDAELPDLFVDVGGVYTAKVKGEDIRFAEVDDGGKFLLFLQPG